MSSKQLSSVIEFNDTMKKMNFVNNVVMVASLLIFVTVMLKPQADFPYPGASTTQINALGQDLVQMFQSNVPVLMVSLAPLLLLITNKEKNANVFIRFSVVLFILSYIINLGIGKNTYGILDQFDQNVGFTYPKGISNASKWGKWTASRYYISRLLRGGAFSCFAVGLLAGIQQNVGFAFFSNI